MFPQILAGQVAVVTGSARGIGAGIVETLAQAGASVVVTDRDLQRAASYAERLVTAGHVAVGVQLDVTDGGSCTSLAASALRAFGQVDLLVNNAGISGRVPLVEMVDDEWAEMIAVNLSGVQRCTRAFVPHMIERGSGSIVSVSSVVGRSGKANMTHYSATKFGVIGFSQALALELAPHGVRVNCVCPGIVRTDPWEVELAEIAAADGVSIDEAWSLTLKGVPLGRPQTVEDIGAAVAFLGSSLAASITGQALNVDGGLVMS